MIHNYRNRPDDATVDGSPPLNRGPQPGWMTLNEARERAFTGEIVFETEPEVRAYLDNGVAYYAERRPMPPLGQRLVEAGLRRPRSARPWHGPRRRRRTSRAPLRP